MFFGLETTWNIFESVCPGWVVILISVFVGVVFGCFIGRAMVNLKPSQYYNDVPD